MLYWYSNKILRDIKKQRSYGIKAIAAIKRYRRSDTTGDAQRTNVGYQKFLIEKNESEKTERNYGTSYRFS
jgi:hypothetical protein